MIDETTYQLTMYYAGKYKFSANYITEETDIIAPPGDEFCYVKFSDFYNVKNLKKRTTIDKIELHWNLSRINLKFISSNGIVEHTKRINGKLSILMAFPSVNCKWER